MERNAPSPHHDLVSNRIQPDGDLFSEILACAGLQLNTNEIPHAHGQEHGHQRKIETIWLVNPLHRGITHSNDGGGLDVAIAIGLSS